MIHFLKLKNKLDERRCGDEVKITPEKLSNFGYEVKIFMWGQETSLPIKDAKRMIFFQK